jgi:hypothetical protein
VEGHPAARRPVAGRLPHLLARRRPDLADLREYQLHDDVRHIDWNVTRACSRRTCGVFTEDREMSAWFSART